MEGLHFSMLHLPEMFDFIMIIQHLTKVTIESILSEHTLVIIIWFTTCNMLSIVKLTKFVSFKTLDGSGTL